jgi:hypothetical protein
MLYDKCVNDMYDNELLNNNSDKINLIHQKKGVKLSDWENHIDHIDQIIVPVTINVCLNSKKYQIDFVKYSKYMIDKLNDGFSGKIYSPYKNTNNDENFKYNKEYIKKLLDNDLKENSEKNAQVIYNYINKTNDSKIRFYLHSIVYHDIFLEESFEHHNTEKFIELVNNKGFKILDSHKKNLNINIVKFNCSTLGIAVFPWMKYLTKNINGCMQVFIDYCTIHTDITNNNYNIVIDFNG